MQNYSSAKFGLVSFAYTLAKEGIKYNIHANSIAPIAASPMTGQFSPSLSELKLTSISATIMPADVLENLKPGHVAPVVAWLCHESCKETGHLYETGAGWSGLLRWETARGGLFKVDDTFTPSAVRRSEMPLCSPAKWRFLEHRSLPNSTRSAISPTLTTLPATWTTTSRCAPCSSSPVQG